MIKIGMFSDVHNGNPHFSWIMRSIFELTDNGKELDAAALVGDIVYHNEKTLPSQATYAMVNANEHFAKLKKEGRLIVAMGNHEFTLGAGDEERTALAKKVFAEETGLLPEYDKVIKGYHFITVGPDDYTCKLSAEQEKFATEKIRAALLESKDKPVFLLLHHSIDNTLYHALEVDTCSDEFEAFVKNEPRLVVISGHTHYPSNDPQSIFQVTGGATFLYTSTIMGGNGLTLPFANVRHQHHPYQGIMMEIDEITNCVTFKPFFVSEGAPAYIEGSVRTIDVPRMIEESKKEYPSREVYKYTPERAKKSLPPRFGKLPEIKSVTDCDVTVDIYPAVPGGDGEDCQIGYFKLELLKDGEVVKNQKIISDFFLEVPREKIVYSMFDLAPSTSYTLKITPYTVWYTKGETTVTLEFETKKPKFEAVELEEVISQGIYDGELSGTFTKYSNLIHIGADWTGASEHTFTVASDGKYRAFVKGSANTSTETTVTLYRVSDSGKEKMGEDEIIINTGIIFTFKDIPAFDFDARKGDTFTLKVEKKPTECTIGLMGISVAKHKK